MSNDRIPPDLIVIDPSLPSEETPLVLGADPAGRPTVGWTVRETTGGGFVNPRALRALMGKKRIVVKTFDEV